MLSNRTEWAVARSLACTAMAPHGAAAAGASGVFDGTAMSTSVAVLGARKPRITDAGYAQGGVPAWSPPV
jgi:hypothetical protein